MKTTFSYAARYGHKCIFGEVEIYLSYIQGEDDAISTATEFAEMDVYQQTNKHADSVTVWPKDEKAYQEWLNG